METDIGPAVNHSYERSGVTSGCTYQLINTQLSEDIHLNPGHKDYIKDPCTICNKGVHVGIQCTLCDKWYHTVCLNITNDDLQALGSTDIEWYCAPCHQECVLPPFSDSDFTEEDSSDIVNPNTILPHDENVDITPLAKDLPLGLKFATWNIQSIKSN